MTEAVRLRPRAESDDGFAHELRSQHAAAMMPGLPPELGAPLCDAQARAFEASLLSYEPVFDWIVEYGPTSVGRLVSCERETEQLLIDLLIAPQFRGIGIGAAALETAMLSATTRGVSTRLSVKKSNPAARLYTRLGFVVTGSDEISLFMQHTPQPKPHYV
ncbi:MAG: GNAT superfamily N-acetyltransferase [Bradymonadia bacterium]|jgi:GNAT superfamily N-acetyltransferase